MADDVQVLNALLRIPIAAIDPGPNARGDVGDVTDLAHSIRTLGLQKPLLVCETPGGRYQVLDGHRRLAALKQLRRSHADAILRRQAPDLVRIQQQLAMHTHAKAFDPIAEAQAIHELMWQHNLTREQIGEALGRSPAWVRDRLALRVLDDEQKAAVAAGRMSVKEAVLLANVVRDRRDGRTPVTAPVRRRKRHCDTCQCNLDGPGP